MNYNPMLMTDFYKIVHAQSYAENMDFLFSYWTPRKSRIQGVDKVVSFGIQYVLKQLLIENFSKNFFVKQWKQVKNEYIRVIKHTMPTYDYEQGLKVMKDLHDLGYLPIRIKAIPEGKLVNIGVPMLEITNTKKGFGWLVNYLETYISCNIWHPMTSATIAHQYRLLVNEYFEKTSDNKKLANVAMGDFSMRGMTSFETAMASSSAHLLSFLPTATIPSNYWLEKYYNANIETEQVGLGTPSMEHSVMSSYGKENEYNAYKRLITEVFPKGNLSIVSDTYNYWRVLTEYLPKLKNDIINRDGRILIRGDSGDPIRIIAGYKHTKMTSSEFRELCKQYESEGFRGCGIKGIIVLTDIKQVCKITDVGTDYYWGEVTNAYCDDEYEEPLSYEEVLGTVELLWEEFGGEINSQGYKVLDKHIRAIYGDSITLERARKIYEILESKGFSVENVVLGIGSYTYQYVTRDTFGFALKATHAIFNDAKERKIYKDPITDTGHFKKSHKGLIVVKKDENSDYYVVDNLNLNEYKQNDYKNQMKVVFEDGKIIQETSLQEIRNILNKGEF